jgi:glycosyltransferase involved in cell wall biosynthesis
VLPGTLKRAKLVRETLLAAAPLLAHGRARLLLAGSGADDALAAEVERSGALLLRAPDEATYERAIVAADAVICVRSDSVGESNGPLLDAIGAWRPSLVTAVGSGPEIAGDSAVVVGAGSRGIRAGLEALLDGDERRERAARSRELAGRLTWDAAARAHHELLKELGCV